MDTNLFVSVLSKIKEINKMSINYRASENNSTTWTVIGIIFIVLTVLALFLFMIITGGLMFVNTACDKQIFEKKQKIEELQKEIEQLAPLKLKINEYKKETEKIKKEIETLKKSN